MSFRTTVASSYKDKVVGTGHCVPFVQALTAVGHTSTWRAGEKVVGNDALASGTAIATFDTNGRYANKATGNHAAIYVSQTADAIMVYDQYLGHAVSLRRIPRRNGVGSASRDADAFSVIEH